MPIGHFNDIVQISVNAQNYEDTYLLPKLSMKLFARSSGRNFFNYLFIWQNIIFSSNCDLAAKKRHKSNHFLSTEKDKPKIRQNMFKNVQLKRQINAKIYKRLYFRSQSIKTRIQFQKLISIQSNEYFELKYSNKQANK